MVKSLSFQCRVFRFNPWSGNKLPHDMCPDQRGEKKVLSLQIQCQRHAPKILVPVVSDELSFISSSDSGLWLENRGMAFDSKRNNIILQWFKEK